MNTCQACNFEQEWKDAEEAPAIHMTHTCRREEPPVERCPGCAFFERYRNSTVKPAVLVTHTCRRLATQNVPVFVPEKRVKCDVCGVSNTQIRGEWIHGKDTDWDICPNCKLRREDWNTVLRGVGEWEMLKN